MGHRTWFFLIFIFSVSAFAFTSFTAGYAVEKYFTPADPRCINSACDLPCPSKFKRHVGPCHK